MNTPIFDQLQGEFLEKSMYCRLRIGPLAGKDFVVTDGITEMIEIETPKPRLYVVEGAPKLVSLEEMSEETEMEKTMVLPQIEGNTSKPPNMVMIDDTQIIPVVKDEEEILEVSKENDTGEPFKPVLIEPEATQHVFPLKRAHHKRNSAASPFSFFSRAA